MHKNKMPKADKPRVNQRKESANKPPITFVPTYYLPKKG
jgi:hypothetical protein